MCFVKVNKLLRLLSILGGIIVTCGGVFSPSAHAGIQRVSVSSTGEQGNSHSSGEFSMSADGRYIAFSSSASNLVSDDLSRHTDIFVKDLVTGAIERVSVVLDSQENVRNSFAPSISGDGRFVAFYSVAFNLAPGDIFVKDRQTGLIQRVIIGSTPYSSFPKMSSDGRFVAYDSEADNPNLGDTNSTTDVFVADWSKGVYEHINQTADGIKGNSFSNGPSISSDGRFVAFASGANNLVVGDINNQFDVFVKDRQTGTIELVSTTQEGIQGNGESYIPAISANGRFVAFTTTANNFAFDETPTIPRQKVFLKDRLKGTLELVNLGRVNGNYDVYYQSLSADGRFIAFNSWANDLVAGDENSDQDVFVKDRITGQIRRVSVGMDGSEPNGDSGLPFISSDGRYIGFASGASNLVPGDTNGKGDIFVAENELFDSDLLRGDVNEDGKINVADAVLLLRIVVRLHTPSERQRVLADMNIDGSVNVVDGTLLLHIVVGL
jgi:Tol biopolymer transport system component